MSGVADNRKPKSTYLRVNFKTIDPVKAILKFLLKLIGGLFITIMLVVVVGYLFLNKPLPNGAIGLQADQLADEMLTALNKPAYDSISYIKFTYRNAYTYEWHKNQDRVTVIAPENGGSTTLDLSKSADTYSTSEKEAYAKFINDSFWLVAPYKVKDKGTYRSTLDLKEGRGLLVTYSAGGVTPGDSYLWIIDEKGFPIAWRMWVSILPVGGLELSWEQWNQYEGAWISTFHASRILEIPVEVHEVRR